MEADNKILAVCLAFIKRELLEHQHRYESLFSSIPAQVIKEDIDVSSFLTDLPNDIIYESHLSELKLQLESEFSEVRSNLRQAVLESNQKVETTNEQLNLQVAHFTEATQTLGDMLLSEITESASTLSSHLGLLSTKLAESVESSQKADTSLSESFNNDLNIQKEFTVNLVNSLKEHSDSVLSKLSNDVFDTVSSLQREVLSKFVELDLEYTSKLDELNHNLSIEIATSSVKVNSAIDLVSTTFSDAINALQQSKADKDHAHDEYALKDHAHDEYITSVEVDAIVSGIMKDVDLTKSLITKIGSSVTAELSNESKQKLISDISSKIKSSLIIPKDGKDGTSALEWDIKWHPSIRGRLGFKRSDWKDYKWQDLIPKLVQNLGGGGAGGFIGPSSPPSAVQPSDGTVQYDVAGNVTSVTSGGVVTTIMRTDGVINAIDKGSYKKVFNRDINGKILGWTIVYN